MPLYGYARVSTTDQDLGLQQAALKAAGCEVVRAEKVSGTGSLGLRGMAWTGRAGPSSGPAAILAAGRADSELPIGTFASGKSVVYATSLTASGRLSRNSRDAVGRLRSSPS